ncbi:hypothetical protein FRB93_006041 [Tulasnella sp. JGI-2019a]|nr:hypothetical protein FRB93_006041 [Tulasnella sp. JGI-2019a]
MGIEPDPISSEAIGCNQQTCIEQPGRWRAGTRCSNGFLQIADSKATDLGTQTKDETPPFGSQKPWSLFEDLTRPLADPRPPSSLIIPLIHALGRDACVATRNALQLYEIISKARDLGDTVNELVMLVYVSDEAAVLRSAKDKYMELERNLRSVLKRLAQVTKDESNPLSIKSIRTWEPNRTLCQTSMRELKSMSLDVKQHKGCLPTQMSWTNATEIDDTEWLARLCRDINLRRNNHDALLNAPSEGGYSLSCSSTFDKIAIDLQQLELSLRLLPKRREVAHLEPDVWEEAAIIISDVKTCIESQNHPLSFPAVLHRWYDFEAR